MLAYDLGLQYGLTKTAGPVWNGVKAVGGVGLGALNLWGGAQGLWDGAKNVFGGANDMLHGKFIQGGKRILGGGTAAVLSGTAMSGNTLSGKIGNKLGTGLLNGHLGIAGDIGLGMLANRWAESGQETPQSPVEPDKHAFYKNPQFYDQLMDVPMYYAKNAGKV